MRKNNSTFLGKLFVENRALLVVNFCILCFICGDELNKYRGSSITALGYILGILTNHYYILYCMLPIVLIVIAKHIKSIPEIEIIRYKNSFCHIRQSASKFAIWIAIYLIMHLAIASIIGFFSFNSLSNQDLIELSIYDELVILLNKYVSFFGNTVAALISIVIYMTFGFTVLIFLLSYINHKFGHRKMIFAAFIIYLLTFAGFKTDLKTIIPVICFNNYILLHHALFVNGVLQFSLILFSGVLIILFSLGKRIRIKRFCFDEFILTKKEVIVALSIPIIAILFGLLRNSIDVDFSTKNVITTVMLGTSVQSSSFISWLSMLILYMVPLFFVGISSSRLNQYGQSPLLIRFKNKADLAVKSEKRYIKFMLLYISVLAALGNILILIPLITANGNDQMLEVFGIGFTNRIFNLFLLIFSVYLLFDFALFRSLSKHLGDIVTAMLILLGKFVFFLLPKANYFMFNFGIINLYENMDNLHELMLKVLILAVLILLYFSTVFWRLHNGNNRR